MMASLPNRFQHRCLIRQVTLKMLGHVVVQVAVAVGGVPTPVTLLEMSDCVGVLS